MTTTLPFNFHLVFGGRLSSTLFVEKIIELKLSNQDATFASLPSTWLEKNAIFKEASSRW